MNRQELVDKRKALIGRIAHMIFSEDFAPGRGDRNTSLLHCMCMAHEAISNELRQLEQDPIAENMATPLTQVLRHLERGLNEDPHANSAFRIAEGLVSRILEDFPTY